jgi:RES domain-containing protein
MPEFKSWRSFRDFERTVKGHRRYIRTPDTEEFLDVVRQTAEKRVEIIPTGTSFFRAQRDCVTDSTYENGELISEVALPYGKDRMKPLRDSAAEGRANPKGIPFLYLATDHDTAIAEVRPWVGAYVSVVTFKTRGPLKVIKCVTTENIFQHWWMSEPPPEKREESVWAWIDESFARPVTPNDNVADYAAPQIIAELFRANGYDGVVYRSSVSETGHNVALFDLDAAEVVHGCVFEVKHVSFKSKQAGPPINYR